MWEMWARGIPYSEDMKKESGKYSRQFCKVMPIHEDDLLAIQQTNSLKIKRSLKMLDRQETPVKKGKQHKYTDTREDPLLTDTDSIR